MNDIHLNLFSKTGLSEKQHGQALSEEEIDRLLSRKTDRSLSLFLSYPHIQSDESIPFDICHEIKDVLSKRGHQVWIDTEQLKGHHGIDWRMKISKGIQDSQAVLSCLNKHAVRTENGRGGVCLDELSIAVSVKGGNIKTILLDPESEVKPNAMLTHRQWLDMSDWQKKYAEGEEPFRIWFRRKMAEVIQMIEDDETYEFDGDITRIRHYLHLTDYQISKRYLLRRPFFGREWLAREVDQWLQDPDGENLCTIFGAPGVGKSMFSVQYAFASPNVGAILCFESGNRLYNSPDAMTSVIAFQLACRLPDYRKNLLAELTYFDSRDPEEKELAGAEFMSRFLINPLTLTHIDGQHETLCIILDGLDECTVNQRNEIASVLQTCLEKFPPWIRFLTVTRKDPAVMTSLRTGRAIEIEENGTGNKADLREYVMSQLAEIYPGSNMQEVADMLLELSSGSFLYAYYVLSDLRHNIRYPDKSYQFPTGLPQAIFGWFSRLFPDPEEYKELFRGPLGAILASRIPLQYPELLSVCRDEYVMHDFLNRFQIFLDEDEALNNKVKIMHRYISDWLSSEKSGIYYVSLSEGERLLGKGLYKRYLQDPEYMTTNMLCYLPDILSKTYQDEQLQTLISDIRFISQTNDLAVILFNRNEYSLMRQTLEYAARGGEMLLKSGRNASATRDLGYTCYLLSMCYYSHGRYSIAAEWISKAVKYSEAYAALSGEKNAWMRFAVYASHEISIFERCKKTKEAVREGKRYLKLFRKKTPPADDPDVQRELARMMHKIGELMNSQGIEFRACSFYLVPAYNLQCKVVRKTDTLSDKLLALSYYSGSIVSDNTALSSLQEFHRQADQGDAFIQVLLDQYPDNTDVLIESEGFYAHCILGLQSMFEYHTKIAHDILELANVYYQKICTLHEIAERLHAPFIERNYQAYASGHIGEMHEKARNYQEALNCYRKALDIYHTIAEHDSDDCSVLPYIGSACSRIVFCFTRLAEYRKAEEFYLRGLENDEKLLSENETLDTVNGVMDLLEQGAYIYYKLGDKDRRKECVQKGIYYCLKYEHKYPSLVKTRKALEKTLNS